MAWEVYTLGGGDYLFNIFNGVAALTAGGAYKNVIALSATIGLMWVLLENAFRNQFAGNIRWFVGFVLAYNILFIPKVDVLIHDKLNPQKPYQVVSNVPYALGVFASMTSTFGNELTKLFETAFSTGNNIQYHTHGLMFGSRLVDAASSFRIVNSTFAHNINSYVKQCVFYDIMFHKYTLDELKQTDDIWGFITKNPSKSRAFEYREGKKREILTCQEGAAKLTPLWAAQVQNATTIFGLKIFPGVSATEAKAKLLSQLPLAYQDILGLSKDATSLIQQNMMINALSSAAEDFTSNTNSGAGSYLAVRSDIQTRTAFQASTRQAEHWLPILRIVFEVLFYGAFPLVFLLMLLPIGAGVARGYFSIFLWLQSWGPLYAIINMVKQGDAKVKSMAASVLADGSHGLTLVTKAGIEVVNQDTAQMAGYIAWSIPVISAGLLYGMKSITGLATSMLAVPQAAVNSAANEVTTGNISLGNANLDNASYGNVNANKFSDSGMFDSGRMQAINSQGGMSSYSSGGNEVHDMSATVSRLPNMQVTKNQSEAVHLTQAASQAMNMGTSLSTQSGYSKSRGHEQIGQFMGSHNISEGHGVNFSKDASLEEREAFHRAQQGIREYAKAHNIDTSTAFGMAIGLNAGFGGGKGNGLGVSGGLSGNADSRTSNNFSDSEKVSVSEGLSKDLNTVKNAVKNNRIEFTDAKGNSLNEGINQNFSEADRYEQQSRTYFDVAKSLSTQAQHVTSNTISTNREVTPDIINHAAGIRDTITGRPMGKLKAAEILSNPSNYPEQYNLIMRHYEGSQPGSSQFSNIDLYNQQAANLGAMGLEKQYEQNANNIKAHSNENLKYDDSMVKNRFNSATEGKAINHNGLKDDVENKIKHGSTQIQNTEIDKAGIKNEIKDKLTDDALVSRAKIIQNAVLGRATEYKSNFEEDNN